MIEWIVLGFIVLLVFFVIVLYNGLIGARLRVDNAFSQIDVQLKRRNDLIPNLVETVKGYAKQEKTVFENVTKARASMMSAGTMAGKAQASDMLTGALKSLFAVAEAYPQLRSSENFQQLQAELSGLEEKIAYSRQFYNDSVEQYNQSIQTFPNVLFAAPFGFTKREFFAASEGERANPKVQF